MNRLEKIYVNECVKRKKYILLVDKLKDQEIADYIFIRYNPCMTLEQAIYIYKFVSDKYKDKIIRRLAGVNKFFDDTIKLIEVLIVHEQNDLFKQRLTKVVIDSKCFDGIYKRIIISDVALEIFRTKLNDDLDYVLALIGYLKEKKENVFYKEISLNYLQRKILDSNDKKHINSYITCYDVVDRLKVEEKLFELNNAELMLNYLVVSKFSETFDREKALELIYSSNSLKDIIYAMLCVDRKKLKNISVDTFLLSISALDVKPCKKEEIMELALKIYNLKSKMFYDDNLEKECIKNLTDKKGLHK